MSIRALSQVLESYVSIRVADYYYGGPVWPSSCFLREACKQDRPCHDRALENWDLEHRAFFFVFLHSGYRERLGGSGISHALFTLA